MTRRAGKGASLRVTAPPDPRFSRYVRERVAGFAASAGVPEADALDFLAAVAEAFANAVQHSRTLESIEIRCWLAGPDRLMASIIDRGIGFNLSAVEPRLLETLADRGRGLSIMRRFADHLKVRSVPGRGTAVLLGRYVGRRPAAGFKP